MQIVVTAAEARVRLGALLRHAEAGDEIIVTRRGAPVAELVPLGPRVGGFARGTVMVNDPTWWHADEEVADRFGT